jgi:hypothetical protein
MSAHSSAMVLDDRQRGVEVMAKATRWLTARAERAEALVALPKNVSEILGVELTWHRETP